MSFSYSFNQTSNSASFPLLQNVSKQQEQRSVGVCCGWVRQRFCKMRPPQLFPLWVCGHKPCCEHQRWAGKLHKPALWDSWCRASEYRRRNPGSCPQATQTNKTHTHTQDLPPAAGNDVPVVIKQKQHCFQKTSRSVNMLYFMLPVKF